MRTWARVVIPNYGARPHSDRVEKSPLLVRDVDAWIFVAWVFARGGTFRAVTEFAMVNAVVDGDGELVVVEAVGVDDYSPEDETGGEWGRKGEAFEMVDTPMKVVGEYGRGMAV